MREFEQNMSGNRRGQSICFYDRRSTGTEHFIKGTAKDLTLRSMPDASVEDWGTVGTAQ